MNSDEHSVGAFLFYLVYLGLSIVLWMVDVSIGKLLVGFFMAIVGGLAPDIIEPPTWPGHRGFFHYTIGPANIIPALIFTNSTNLVLSSVDAFRMGYFSHFILDILS